MTEPSSVIPFAPDPIVDGGCDGSGACRAKVHIHGCFADAGNCDPPDEEHGPLDVRELGNTFDPLDGGW